MKIIKIFLLLVLLVNTANAELLINNLNTNAGDEPFSISETCLRYDTICATRSDDYIINGEAIKITENMGTLDAIKIALKRKINNPTYSSSTITIRVYKSLDETPSSSKYLWDSITLNPSSESMATYMFTFDYPIEVYNEFDIYTVKWLWIELQQTGTKWLLDYNPVYYGYYVHSTENKYIYSDVFQYNNVSWSLIEAHLSPSYYRDITFGVYGTWHFNTTPLPTPTEIADDGDIIIPCYDCNETIPSPDDFGNTTWSPDFNDTSIPCPECIGNESVNPYNTIPSDSATESFLKTFGYCNSLGCTSKDIINFIYDITFFMIYLSFGVVLYKWYTEWRS